MKQEILNRKFIEVREKLDKLGYEKERILGIFLYGSQNYGTDTPNSDFDFKVIVLPEFERFIFGGHRVSKTYQLNKTNEDQIEVKDILTMMDMWKKGNPAYLEILDSPYFWTDYPEYIEELKTLNIATINNLATVNAIYGMALQKRKALCHPYPAKKAIIEEFGYDAKQLSHIARLNDILSFAHFEQINKHNIDFNINDQALNMKRSQKVTLADFKEQGRYSQEMAMSLADTILDSMKIRKNEMLDYRGKESGALKFNTFKWDELSLWATKIIKKELKRQLML